MIFKDKSRDNIETVLTKVSNLKTFIEYIVQKRGYNIIWCKVVIGLDEGHMKLILTMNLIPYNESEIRDKYKATRKKEESLL